MELWLVDINSELVDAWQTKFKGFDNVYTECGDILKLAENTIVSPANSYGEMDGGIDLNIRIISDQPPKKKFRN